MTVKEIREKLANYNENEEVHIWIRESEGDAKIEDIQMIDDIIWIEIETCSH